MVLFFIAVVAAAFLLAYGITAAVGPSIIVKLRKLKCGGTVLDIGPKWHLQKGNIPIMGGFMFILGTILSTVIILLSLPWVNSRLNPGYVFTDLSHWTSVLAVLGLALCCGLIGFLDDFKKVKKKRNLGLTVIQKLLLQIAAAVVFILVMQHFGLISPHIVFPFLNVTWELPWAAYIPFMAFVIVGCVNAVNLTDGLDGLAGGVTFFVAAFFAYAALLLFLRTQVSSLMGTAALSAALCGSLGAFLIFNFSPAKVWMGDTGALFLGAMVCGLGFAIDLPIILIPVGIVYVIETLSDILQIGYFKLTHGKRIFKMAPIHHHFELCGYSEKQIVVAAYLITIVFCALSAWGVWML